MRSLFGMMILYGAVLCFQVRALEFDPGLVTMTTGSWIALPAHMEPAYFSKVSLTCYSTVGAVKVVPSIPLAYTYESGTKKQRLFPGDASLYVGRRIGQFEPRAGVIVPLGYGLDGDWKNKAWIGTNNVEAEIGLAYGRADDATEGMPLTIEAMIAAPLTQRNAYLHRGSVSLSVFGKSFWRISDRVRWGAEIMLLASRSVWDWTYEAAPGTWEQVVESSAGAVPHVWAEYRLSDTWFCSLKAGFGPQFGYSNRNPGVTHSGNSLNLSLGAQWYP